MAIKTVSEILKTIFELRKARNKNYSVRAFARDCKVSPATASLLLKGKAKLSPARADSISKNLDLSKNEEKELRLLAEYEAPRSDDARKIVMLKTIQTMSPFAGAAGDSYRLIADWYHLPICELTELAGFRSEPAWIAHQLGISEQDASSAIERLLKLGMLVKKNGVLQKSQPSTIISLGPYSKAIRQSHRDFIQLALRAMDRQKPSERYFSSTVIRCRSKDIQTAWRKVKTFRQSLMVEMESGDRQDSVYALGVQLFRLAPQRKPRARSDEKLP